MNELNFVPPPINWDPGSYNVSRKGILTRYGKKFSKEVVKVDEFLEDDEVKVVNNLAGHNTVGHTYTVRGYLANNRAYIQVKENNFNYLLADLKLLPLSKKKLQERHDKAKAQWENLSDKLAYLEETKKPKLDEAEYKKHQIKSLLENHNLPLDVRAERIQNLFVVR